MSLHIPHIFLATSLLVLTAGLSSAVKSDEFILDDLVVDGSLCVGSDCGAAEVFDFDSIRLKSSDPLLEFIDTSNSASFPTNDWSLGVANTGAAGAPQFFLKDVNAGANVLLLESGAAGGVALGAASSIEAGAISVGSAGSERRVVFVDDGTDPTDAATRGQLDAFISSITGAEATQLASDRAALDAEIAGLETELADLLSRISALETALGN